MTQTFGNRITPYFTIWTEPRATIRRIVETNPERNVILLAALAPVLAVLEREWMRAVQGHVPQWWTIQVLFEVIFAAMFGIGFLYIGAMLISSVARMLGGVGTALETRTAMAWARIPAITATAAVIVALLAGAMTPPEIGINGLPKLTPPAFELGGVHFVLGLWGFVVGLKCIGEVHRFSAWRALLAELIVLVSVVLVAAGLFGLITALSQSGHH